MKTKQTAVEFIVKQLDCLNKERKDKLISAETFFNHKINLIEEAKRMEKEQIIDARLTLRISGVSYKEEAEQYYNETFKQD